MPLIRSVGWCYKDYIYQQILWFMIYLCEILPLLISEEARICEWSSHNNAVFDVNWIKVAFNFCNYMFIKSTN